MSRSQSNNSCARTSARFGGLDFGGRRAFRQCWDAFLRHVAEDAPPVPTLVEDDKAVQLAEFAYRCVAENRWMTVPDRGL